MRQRGRRITISQAGAVFQLAHPQGGFFFFPGMRFAPYGSQLIGRYIPDSDDLEDRFENIPSAVLNQAAATRSCIYVGTLTMLGDGRIAVEHNNLRVLYSREGRFSRCDSYDGWVRFTLSR